MVPTHDITILAASAQTQNFQATHPGLTKGGKFPKADVLELLSQTGCSELRYYFGVADPAKPNDITIVLVGVDSNGNDMVNKLKNAASPCPPWCGGSNLLNHLIDS